MNSTFSLIAFWIDQHHRLTARLGYAVCFVEHESGLSDSAGFRGPDGAVWAYCWDSDSMEIVADESLWDQWVT